MTTKDIYLATLGANSVVPTNHGIVKIRDDGFVYKPEWEEKDDDGWTPAADFGYVISREITEGPFPHGEELFQMFLKIIRD